MKKIEALKAELKRMVEMRGGKMDIIDTCVNVHFRCGNMMLTPTYNTLEHNLQDCIRFTKEYGRVGTIWPVERPLTDNFGKIAGKVMKLKRDQAEAHEMNSLISSEFTSCRDDVEMSDLLMDFGMTPEDYNEELTRRCKVGYRLHCMLRA